MSDTTLHLHPEVASHDVYEEEHHGHKETFISKYVFSMDHKTISKQFLITGIFWAIIGGFFSVLFRLQLGFPDQSFPFLETLFGHWAQGGKISPEFYYGLITMHGTILVFFVLTAGLSGTYANLLIPLQIGARDMASPFLNMLSYWFFFLAGCIMLASLFISTGPAAGGWTIYPPLSALGEASIGSKLGMDLWLVSMAFFIVSSLLGGLNYISTILNMRTKGMTMTRMPLTMWAFFFTAVIGVLSFPVLLSGAILLIFDRSFGTSFFLSDIYINGQALPNQGGSPILFQHLCVERDVSLGTGHRCRRFDDSDYNCRRLYCAPLQCARRGDHCHPRRLWHPDYAQYRYEKFSGSVGILRNFSFTILLWPLVMFMSLVTLAFNKYNYILITSVSSSLISIILSLLLIRNYGISGAGFVLPFVAGGTILINLFFLKKIAAEENFRLYSLFSIVTAVNELKILFKK